MKPTVKSNVIPSPEVLFQEFSGEAVLLDLASEAYFGLDEVGSRIWRLLQEQENLLAVYNILLDEYNVEPTQLEVDLLSLVTQLADAGLVTIDGEDHATP